MKINTKHSLLLLLFMVSFLERAVFDLGPNIELVTMSLVLTSFYVGRGESFWLTLTIMMLTDLVIGNTNIFLFTWSGFLIPAIFAKGFFPKAGVRTKIFRGALAGMASTGFFFVWTNFGVWLLSSMYPKNALGLVMSYVNALPFLRYQAMSTIIFVPLGITLVELAALLNKKFEFEKRISKVIVLT